MSFQVQRDEIDLWQLGFMFAIEDIDPSIGRIEANLISWQANTSNPESTPVTLVSCKELQAGGLYEGQTNNEALDFVNPFQGRKQYKDLLCPVGLQSLTLQGNFGSENFTYMEISLKGC